MSVEVASLKYRSLCTPNNIAAEPSNYYIYMYTLLQCTCICIYMYIHVCH